MALHLINVIVALIRQLVNLKGAPDGEVGVKHVETTGGGRRKEALTCIQMSALVFVSSSPSGFYWF